MSNYDHLIDMDVKETLLTTKKHACYPGWNFHSRVWHKDGQWYAEVWRYGSYVETISDAELTEVKSQICDKYGND